MADLAAQDGIETYVASISSGADAGLRARLQTSCREVVTVDGDALWDLRALARLVRVIRDRRIDVVHTHLAVADVLGALAAKATGRPVVSSLHNIAADRYTHTGPRRVIARFASRRLADRLIAVSDVVRSTHEEQLRIPASKLRVIRNVPIAPFLLPHDFDPARKRAELGLSGAIVSTVARLAVTKDHATLFAAFKPIVGRRPDATLLVVGDGPNQQPLELLVEQLGIGGNVRFLGSRADAVELMAASDVVCNITFAFEGLPIAVLDAMSLGVPLVATRVPGVEEVVEHGKTALLVPAGDPLAVEQAIEDLLAHRDRALAIGAAARASINAQLDPRAWIESIEAVYREILEEPGLRQRIGSQLR
jgi:glycosyltransferase involved in cell wall biosynthesis